MNDDYQPSKSGGPLAEDSPIESDCPPLTPSIDDVFDLLADDTRREICLYLMDGDSAVVTVTHLVDVLAEEDTDRDRLAINLHHRHLPKLSEAGILEYDARSNTARYWGQPTVEKWAEHVDAVSERTEPSFR